MRTPSLALPSFVRVIFFLFLCSRMRLHGKMAQTLTRSSVFCTVVVSERLVDRVKMCEIRDEIYGASDHCPVVMEIEGAL